MKTKYKILLLLTALSILVWLGFAVGNPDPSTATQTHGRKILCYQDSMHPWVKSDRPGKCTICAMDLTPIYEGTPGFEVSEDLIVLSSNNITVLNVQTEPVQRQSLRRTLRVAGTLEASETSKRVIAAGKAGRIERLAVPYVGFEVIEGERLANFFIPELLAEARRYILLARSDMRGGQAHATDLSNPLLAALQNLRLFGLTEAQIENLAQTGKAEGSFEILSPLTGTVIERNVSEGQYVSEGTRLFTIVDLSVLWFRFDAYEQDLAWLQVGQSVELTVPTAPGQVFSGPIVFIEPLVNDTTRTAKVRVDVANPPVEINGVKQPALRQQQYAEGRVRAEAPARLVIPSTAVLLPGGQPYAYVDKGGGVYELRQLKLGRRGDQHCEVLGGLEDGESVVTTGNVLIDAQAQFNRGASGGKEDTLESASESAQVAQGADQRQATVSAASTRNTELSPTQQKALKEFLAAADGVSRALAADRLDRLKPHMGSLPALVASLAKELGPDHAWQPLVKRIQAATRWGTPANLGAAREVFLPFSTNVVELVQQVRAQEESLRSLKVYHCPMAPKPGLWFQAEGPLRNPYYGAEMLNCGQEVKSLAATPKAPSKPLAKLAVPTAPSAPQAQPNHAPPKTVAPSAPPSQVNAIPPAQPAGDRVPSYSEIQPINSRDHSVFDNRMNDAITARFALLGPSGTNALQGAKSPAPRSANPTGSNPPPPPNHQH